MDTSKDITTIQVSKDTWRIINAAKREPKESMDKALRRLIEERGR